MKLVAFLIIAVSMCVGVVGALTAYVPPLSLSDSSLENLTLNAPAGNTSSDPRKPAPIATRGAVLTPELLATLRAANVQRVKVKEFSLARWPEWWLFVLGCLGLGGGAMLVRSMRRKAVAASIGARGGGMGGGVMPERAAGPATSATLSPAQLIDAMRADLEALRGKLRATPAQRDRLAAIVADLGHMQQTHIAAFLNARPEITARLGLGGYARLMDVFSAAERAINRAWSAAADDVENEAMECLDRAAELLEEAKGRA
ncbi:MAG: hypothetical protein KF869_11585 [Phycisphaeraceae bacterium]|nr:hypothetical protein [Phycisphaeraceae bacterium]